MEKKKIESINEYVNLQSEEGKQAVEHFVAFMEKEFSHCKPCICFAMPMWKLYPKMRDGYVAISTAKHHVTIHVLNDMFIHDLKACNIPCKFGKGCVNIPYGDVESRDIVYEKVRCYVLQELEKKANME